MNDFLAQAADILETDGLSPDFEFRTVAWWDSLKGFALMVLIERAYGVRMTPDDFRRCRTLADLARVAGVPASN